MFETRLFENFSDLDRVFAAMKKMELREPKFSAADDGEAYVVRAELPGIPASALEITLTGQVLKLKARRNTEAPAGFVVHRRERVPLELTRSVTLPTKVDAERVTAKSEDGIVTITLPKAAESKPRTITVQ